MMNLEQAEALARSRLSQKRFEHTKNVRDMAVRLAQHYGADQDQAALAALLHDIAKEIPEKGDAGADASICTRGSGPAGTGLAWHMRCDPGPHTVGGRG